jgi:HAD superfamily hydrolase (TIGR01458 family)
MSSPIPFRGILLDIDGVLHVSMKPIQGAIETLSWLRQHRYQTCFVTNTTTLSQAALAERLQGIGLAVSEHDILTAPVATAEYIRRNFPGKRCWVLTKGATAVDFAGIELVDDHADIVVIGGAEELLTYETLNHAFRMLMDGATLLAMHTNRYWRTSSGLQLDSGPFVRALEMATGKQAIVLGKPNAAFFAQALHMMNISADEALMVGDDIENDVAGAQQAGIRAVLVCTGKHAADHPLLQSIHPDAILPSIADLPRYLSKVSIPNRF